MQEPRSDASWDRDLDAIAEPTVVVVLALHGGADDHGAYLLPQDAAVGDDDSNRVRLAGILERLARLPAGKNKVLILDATQMAVHWQLGMLANDFARALDELNDRIAAIPNLVVLSASAAEQCSWNSPEWGQTAFGHYLVNGLRGAADTDGNNRVTTLELFHYLRDKVHQWSSHHRGAAQTPVLLPRGAEGEKRAGAVTVALAPQRNADRSRIAVSLPSPLGGEGSGVRDYTPPSPPTPLPQGERGEMDDLRSTLPLVQAAWEQYHKLRTRVPSLAALSPQLWRQYEASVLRYEQLLRFGDETSASRLRQRLDELEEQIQQAPQVCLRSADNTLTMPVLTGEEGRRRDSVMPEVDRKLKELWEAPTLDDARRQWREWTQQAGKGAPRRELTELLLERAALDPESLPRVAPLLQVLRSADAPPPAEAHFAIMLQRDQPVPTPSAEYKQLVSLAVHVRLLAERALAAHPVSAPMAKRFIRGSRPDCWQPTTSGSRARTCCFRPRPPTGTRRKRCCWPPRPGISRCGKRPSNCSRPWPLVIAS